MGAWLHPRCTTAITYVVAIVIDSLYAFQCAFIVSDLARPMWPISHLACHHAGFHHSYHLKPELLTHLLHKRGSERTNVVFLIKPSVISSCSRLCCFQAASSLLLCPPPTYNCWCQSAAVVSFSFRFSPVVAAFALGFVASSEWVDLHACAAPTSLPWVCAKSDSC